MRNVDRFWDYLAQSIIVQALITVIVVLTLCYMFLAGRDVPESLIGMAMLILGFWFGTKSQKIVATRAKGEE